MKGQGLPITAVILIIMAILILILAIVFVVLPILGFSTTTTSTNSTLSSFEFNCGTYCGVPSNGASNNNNPVNTEFCSANVDYQGTTYHCWSDAPGSSKQIASCSYTADDGTPYSNLDSASCG